MLKNKFMKNSEEGITLYLSVVIMAMVLSVALGISTIFSGQLNVLRNMGYSVIAFYAADAGIENILTIRGAPVNIPTAPLSNGATYEVSVRSAGINGCVAANYCIKSIGSYKETNRAIEVNY